MQAVKMIEVGRSALRASALVGVLLVGCASQPDVSIEEQVGSRALQWVDALIELDYDRALTFMTPTYQKSARAERFRGEFSGAGWWRGAEIKWVKCDEEGTPPAIPDAVPSPSPEESASVSDAPDDCVVSSWNNCGAPAPSATPNSTSVSVSSRCEVRLMLTVMKAPEMSTPMTIPYQSTWLNLSGAWYMYRD